MMYRLDLRRSPRSSTRLVGDYNLDGMVDAADYIVWRNTLGSTTELRANGDNTGDEFRRRRRGRLPGLEDTTTRGRRGRGICRIDFDTGANGCAC